MLPAIVAEALAFLQQLLVRDRSGSEAEMLCDTVLEVRPSGCALRRVCDGCLLDDWMLATTDGTAQPRLMAPSHPLY